MTDEFTGWRTSRTCDGGACIEVGIKLRRWRKSSRCASNECVEVGTGLAVVGVRDTVLADASPVLEFRADAWKRFTEALRAP